MLNSMYYALIAAVVAGAFFVPGLREPLARGYQTVMRLFFSAFFALIIVGAAAPHAKADDAPVGPEVAAIAPGNAQTPINSQNLPVYLDEELATKHVDFTKFAKKKVVALNKNHRLSRSRMQITKQPDGSYRARFHEVDESSLAYKVRRSKSKTIPFVAILSYKEKVYEAVAESPKACRKADFIPVAIIPNRHIFSYKKGTWK